MSAEATDDGGAPSELQWALVDGACSRFDTAWRTGQRPRIEDFLPAEWPEMSTATRVDLLVQLVGNDLEWRWKTAEMPSPPAPLPESEGSQSSPPATLPGGEGSQSSNPASLPEGKRSQSSPVASLPEGEGSIPLPCRPRLADYVARYAMLGPVEELPSDLIVNEYYSRRRYGDRPTHAEYLDAFGSRHPDLAGQLQAVDDGMAAAGRLPPDGGAEDGPPPDAPVQLLGEYVLLEKLGEGGMGVVYKARHQRMKRLVAVKMIAKRELGSPEAVRRFYREVETAAKLEHPNIVTAYDAGEQAGVQYLVMQYVEGQDLAAVVQQRGPLPIAQAVDYVIQAARGLQYAHKHQIVHRDIKPGNLLLDKEGTVKILDLGLAIIAGLTDGSRGDRLTGTGQVMGTCDYMAPEQATDARHADARVDIYALGCTLYRLLTGHAPYRGESLPQILMAHRESPIPALCQDRPDVPPQLDAAFRKMIAKKPEDRYQSMTEVIAALETCAGKRGSTAASAGDDATAAFPTADGPDILRGASPGNLATAVKKKIERIAEATCAQQTAAAETSKHRARDAKPATVATVARWKRTLAFGIGLGLLGVAAITVLTVIIHIHHPDGKDTAVQVPEGSKVEVGKDGQVVVTLPKSASGKREADAPPPAAPGKLSPGAPLPANTAEDASEPVVFRGHVGFCWVFVLSPKGRRMASGGDDRVVRIWDLDERKEILQLKGHSAEISAVAYSADGRRLLSCSRDKTIRLWDLESGKEIARLDGPEVVDCALFLPEERQVLAGYHDGIIRLWDVESHREVRSFHGAGKVIYSMAMLADGHRFLSAGFLDRTLSLWDLEGEKPIRSFLAGGGPLPAMAVTADGRKAVSGGYDGVVRLWNVETGEETLRLKGHTSQLWCVAVSGDGRWAASGASNCVKTGSQWKHVPDAVRLWDLSSGQEIASYHFPVAREDWVRCLRFSADNRYLYGSEQQGLICRWRLPHTVAERAAPPSAAIAPTATRHTSIAADDMGTAAQAAIGTPPSPLIGADGKGKLPIGAPPPAVAPFDSAKAKEHQAAWAKYLGVPVEMTNSIGMKLVLIPPGEFMMGSPEELIEEELKPAPGDSNWYLEQLPGEGQRHRVRITRSFYLGTYFATQEEYRRVTGADPSEFSATGTHKDKVAAHDTQRFPVDSVSWQDANMFCSRLSEVAEEKSAGRRYRLPSEAQWEYACRAGNTGQRFFSPESTLGHSAEQKKFEEDLLLDYAWIGKNAGGRTHAVGGKRANTWGLYDIHGNLAQWCQDWYGKNYYSVSPVDDPEGPNSGSDRVNRGGCWDSWPRYCRSGNRGKWNPSVRGNGLGVRVSLILPDTAAGHAVVSPEPIVPAKPVPLDLTPDTKVRALKTD